MRGSYTSKDCLTAPCGFPEPATTNPSRSITRRRSRSGRWEVNGNPVPGVNGVKVPIYGINGHDGRTGHGNFSWMLQIETQKQNVGRLGEP